jgi:alkaline phosphatase D
MGDAAYTDDIKKAQWVSDNSMDLEYIKSRFLMTENDPVYAKFAKETPVIGVWDDHDYGCNNAGKAFSKKNEIREMFLDFVKEPKDSERRTEKNTGIYQDYVIIT